MTNTAPSALEWITSDGVTGMGHIVLYLGGMLATAIALRWWARVRWRRLPTLLRTEGAEWIALARVWSGGTFLDHGRHRRGLGPRGTLLAYASHLEWRPDHYEVTHGDTSLRWLWSDVRCTSRRRRLDITGVRIDLVALAVPEGTVTFGLFGATGVEPSNVRFAPET